MLIKLIKGNVCVCTKIVYRFDDIWRVWPRQARGVAYIWGCPRPHRGLQICYYCNDRITVTKSLAQPHLLEYADIFIFSSLPVVGVSNMRERDNTVMFDENTAKKRETHARKISNLVQNSVKT